MKKVSLPSWCFLLLLLLMGQATVSIGGIVEEKPTEPPLGFSTGSLAVGPTGAATYTIPIEVPQGVGGMQPTLSIVYNSQAGNGIAGWGCSLSGVSAITRAPKNIYHDGTAKGLTHSTDEAYYLDGQRLICSSGAPGQVGATYYLESDPFTQIVVRGTSTADTWFEVLHINGTRYRYGETITNGRHNYSIDGSPKTHAWYLEYAEDIMGNLIAYSYFSYNNYMYLWAITYGSNMYDFISEQRGIYLDYELRNDATPFVINGISGKISYRLTCISISSQNTYELRYDDSSDQSFSRFSRLTSVTVKNAMGEAREPIALTWNYLPPFQQNIKQPVVNNTSSLGTGGNQLISGDFNGDGLTDIANITAVNSGLEYYSLVRVNASLHYASVNAYENTQLSNANDYSLGSNEVWDDGWIQYQDGQSAIDFDGNGTNELLIPKLNITSKWKNIDFIVYGSKLHLGLSHALKHGSEIPLYNTGDFDRDGRGDIVYIEKGHSNGRYSGMIIGYNGTTSVYASFELTLPSTPDKIFVADFDGDGMDDMLVFYSGGYAIFWNQGKGINTSTFTDNERLMGSNIGNVHMIRQGDFNGDGLPDFIMSATDDNRWYFAVNNGNGIFSKQLAYTFAESINDQDTNKDNDKFSCQVFDFDMDGKSDVVITKGIYYRHYNFLGIFIEWLFDKTHTYWMRSNGISLTQIAHATSSREEDAIALRYLQGDFNGDGQVELMNYGYDCYNSINANSTPLWRIYKAEMAVGDGKVTYVTDNYGGEAHITYSSLVGRGIYTKDSKVDYPLADLALPLHVVKSTLVRNGAAGGLRTNYRYSGLKAHLQGRGILGMVSQATHNELGMAVESGVSEWNSTFYIPSKTYTKTTVDGTTAETSVTMSIVDKGNKKYFTYPSTEQKKDLDGNTVSTSYRFDHSYGYPLYDSTSYDNGMYRTVRQEKHTYTAAGPKPQLITMVQKHPDDDKPFVQKTYMEYNTSNGLPLKKVENYGSTKPLTTEYTSYDAVGNVLTQRVSSIGIPTTTYHTEYDATKLRVAKAYATTSTVSNGSTRTVPASTVRSFTYDSRGSVLTEEEEISAYNILNTTHTYSSWGGRTSTILPDGRKTTYSWGWSSGNYFTLTRPAGQPWVRTWYDRNGREISEETVGAKSMPIQRQTTYTRKGQVESTQTQTGDITTTENYTYDARGRCSTTSSSTGRRSTYTYGNRSTTIITNERGSYTKSCDAWGGVKTADDPASSIAYTYSSTGKPRSISTGGATFSMEYDDIGNQSKLIDPNAGTLTYAYDALGRLTRQVDGSGKITGRRYDTRGRLAADTVGGIVTTYIYGQGGQDHWPSEVYSGAGNTVYTYDKYGRVLTEQQQLHIPEDGNDFHATYTYGYNTLGQLSSTEYPSGVVANLEYDEHGYLIKVLVGGQTVWELTEATGTRTTARLGSAITAMQTYDSNRLLSNQNARTSGTMLYNFDYGMNGTTGNLSYRGDSRIPQWENFYYDDLDRLTMVEVNGIPVMSIGYEPNGNISRKTGLGQYSYAQYGAGVHAVTAVENPQALTSSESQEIRYTAFNKVASISERVGSDNLVLDFAYTPDRQQRWKTVLKKNGEILRTLFYAGDYEKVVEDETTTELTYLPGGAIHVRKTGQNDKMLYSHTDHLGSIVSITEGNGTELFKASYDAWGRQTVSNSTFKFHRGFTGHEHLPEFGLINMNGRMYDPMLARFLSPDPYVQMPDFSQNYNRYSYCLNNPLKYTDPSGEFFTLFTYAFDFIQTAFFKGGLDFTSPNHMKQAWKEFDPTAPWSKTNQAAKLEFGTIRNNVTKWFNWQSDATFWEYLQEFSSKIFPTEMIQSTVGYNLSKFKIWTNKVEEVGYHEDRTTLRIKENGLSLTRGISLGRYILGEGMALNPDDTDHDINLFYHEFGHTYQSRTAGFAYLFKYGIPSAARSKRPEKDADIRAYKNFGVWPHGYYTPSNFDELTNVRWWELLPPIYPILPFINY